MPKTSNGTGYGAFTSSKLSDYATLLNCYVPLAVNVIRKWPNLYQPELHVIDINAGPGEYGHDDPALCYRGSPLIALDKLTEERPNREPTRYSAWFIDEQEENCRQLEVALQPYANPYGSHQIVHGKHEDLLKDLLSYQRLAALGLLYHDPNGFASWDCLSEISNLPPYRTIDFLIHYGAATPKRFFGRFGKHYVMTADQAVASIQKSHWLVQEPLGHTQWTFLLGTNYARMPAWSRLRFHPLASNQGKAILSKIAYTKAQYQESMYTSGAPLFDEASEEGNE